MTCEEAKGFLEKGEMLHFHVWVFIGLCMNCPDGCCDFDFSATEELLDHIEWLVDSDWDLVEKL